METVLTVPYQCMMAMIMTLTSGQRLIMLNLDILIIKDGGLISLMAGITMLQLVLHGDCIPSPSMFGLNNIFHLGQLQIDLLVLLEICLTNQQQERRTVKMGFKAF